MFKGSGVYEGLGQFRAMCFASSSRRQSSLVVQEAIGPVFHIHPRSFESVHMPSTLKLSGIFESKADAPYRGYIRFS